MGLVYGRLEHDSTFPAGSVITFRSYGIVIGTATTDAGGYYAVTLPVCSCTAKVGVELCLPNPLQVPYGSINWDLEQQRLVESKDLLLPADEADSPAAETDVKRVFFFYPERGAVLGTGTTVPNDLSGAANAGKYRYQLHTCRGSVAIFKSGNGEYETSHDIEDCVLVVENLKDEDPPKIPGWLCTNPK